MPWKIAQTVGQILWIYLRLMSFSLVVIGIINLHVESYRKTPGAYCQNDDLAVLKAIFCDSALAQNMWLIALRDPPEKLRMETLLSSHDVQPQILFHD